MIVCVINNISLWPAVVEDIEVTLGYVHTTWDTNGEEVTLEFINKEKEIDTEKVTNKLNMSAKWLKDIPKNDTITFKAYIILFGNVNYCYAIIFRLLPQLNWRDKEEVWLFPHSVYH